MADKNEALDAVRDLVESLLYYYDDLPSGEIEWMVAAGELTVDEMAAVFLDSLRAALPP